MREVVTAAIVKLRSIVDKLCHSYCILAYDDVSVTACNIARRIERVSDEYNPDGSRPSVPPLPSPFRRQRRCPQISIGRGSDAGTNHCSLARSVS